MGQGVELPDDILTAEKLDGVIEQLTRIADNLENIKFTLEEK